MFRGAESERLGDFIQRMQDLYPGSELLKTTEIPPEILSSDGMHLLIVSVTPSSKEEMEKQVYQFY